MQFLTTNLVLHYDSCILLYSSVANLFRTVLRNRGCFTLLTIICQHRALECHRRTRPLLPGRLELQLALTVATYSSLHCTFLQTTALQPWLTSMAQRLQVETPLKFILRARSWHPSNGQPSGILFHVLNLLLFAEEGMVELERKRSCVVVFLRCVGVCARGQVAHHRLYHTRRLGRHIRLSRGCRIGLGCSLNGRRQRR